MAVLKLVVVTDHGVPPAQALQATFDERGGTLGRSPEATWVLPDPERRISRLHASVVCRQDRWFIELRSVVGTLSVNGVAVAADTPARLEVGDIIRIGGFVIEVSAAEPSLADRPRDPLDTDEGPTVAMPRPAELDGRFAAASGDPDPFAAFGSERTMIKPAAGRTPRAASIPDHWINPPAADNWDPLVAGMSSAEPQILAHRPAAPMPMNWDPAPPPPPAPIDDVSLGAAAPATCQRGHWFIAHFAAYPPGDEAFVSALLQEQSPAAQQHLGKRSCRWAPGTVVTVELRAEGFEVPLARQVFTWNGNVETLDFRLRATDGAPHENVLEFVVSIAGFTVAVVCLNIHLGQQAAVRQTQARVVPVRKAFASYASADRGLVVHMVGAIQRSAGVQVFLDCLDLQASESWKPRLAGEIAASEQFLLFWSRHARASRWVGWELQEALRDKDARSLQLHPLEPGVPAPPGLEHLHSDSVHALVAAYHSQQPWWRRVWRALT